MVGYYTCDTHSCYIALLDWPVQYTQTHRLPSFLASLSTFTTTPVPIKCPAFSSPPPRFHDSPRQVSHSQLSTFYCTPFSSYQLLVCLTCQFIYSLLFWAVALSNSLGWRPNLVLTTYAPKMNSANLEKITGNSVRYATMVLLFW